jgi:hypothetical protein
METTQKDAQSKAVQEALQEGRNANDNFKDSDKDDYGTDSPEQEIERDEIKGGTGQRGKERNRNDDFNDEQQ